MRSAVRNSLVADHMLSKTLAHTSGPFVVNLKKFHKEALPLPSRADPFPAPAPGAR